jgi:hypothetical protein
MIRIGRLPRYAAASLVAATLAVGTLGVTPAHAASGVPYTDKRATGFLTLYDKTGQPIKSGDVHDKPFVWKAVASVKAPAGYGVTGAKAVLGAYQPREGVDAAQWSGDFLTASTVYTDAGHPAASATATDFSLQDFLDEFPVRWDGLIQLRLYLGAPGQPTLNTSYASTDLRIVGQNWVVIGGGPGAGTGGANIPGKVAPGLADAAASAGGSGAASNGADAANTADNGPLAAVLPVIKAPATLAIAAAVIVALVLGGMFWRRRRSQGGS